MFVQVIPPPEDKVITLTAHLPMSVAHTAAFELIGLYIVAYSRNTSRCWKYTHRILYHLVTTPRVEQVVL